MAMPADSLQDENEDALEKNPEDETVYSAVYAPASAELNRWFKVQAHLYSRSDAERSKMRAREMDVRAQLMEEKPLDLRVAYEEVVEAEPEVIPEPVIHDPNVMNISDFNGLFKSERAAAQTDRKYSEPPKKEDALKKEEKKSWGESLFSEDELSAGYGTPLRKSLNRPEGYKLQDDINQPVIWKKQEYGRGINLSDD
jgi:hypothetical protein